MTEAAAAATLGLVCSVLLLACVNADAATDLSALLAVLLFKTFAAAAETFLLVVSDFAMGLNSLLNRPAPIAEAA